jgi:glycosyl transferase family 61
VLSAYSAAATWLRTLRVSDARLYRRATLTMQQRALTTQIKSSAVESDLAAVDEAGSVIEGTFVHESESPPTLAEGPSLPDQYLQSGFLFYTNPWSENFQHFFVELFPKLVDYMALRRLGRRRLPLLVPRRSHNRLTEEVFALFGISTDVVLLEPDTRYHVEKLWSSGYTRDYRGITAKLLHAFTLLRQRLHTEPPTRSDRRLYLARGQHPDPTFNDNAGGAARVISNHGDLLEIMAQRGFETVTLGTSSLDEKVQRLSGCDVLVSPLGANLVNCLLMPPPGPRKILILHSDAYQSHGYMAQLIEGVLGAGIQFAFVQGAALAPGQVNSAFSVDPQEFAEALDNLMAAEPTAERGSSR